MTEDRLERLLREGCGPQTPPEELDRRVKQQYYSHRRHRRSLLALCACAAVCVGAVAMVRLRPPGEDPAAAVEECAAVEAPAPTGVSGVAEKAMRLEDRGAPVEEILSLASLPPDTPAEVLSDTAAFCSIRTEFGLYTLNIKTGKLASISDFPRQAAGIEAREFYVNQEDQLILCTLQGDQNCGTVVP